MKEIFFQLDDLHPDLISKLKNFVLEKSEGKEATPSSWPKDLMEGINFTNEFQISLFHEGFSTGESPPPPEDVISILFVKFNQAKIYNDPSGEYYYHCFVSSWDTTKEPSLFLLKGFEIIDVEELIDNFISHFGLMRMG